MANDRIRAKMSLPKKIFYSYLNEKYGNIIEICIYLLAHSPFKKFKKRAISIYRDLENGNIRKKDIEERFMSGQIWQI